LTFLKILFSVTSLWDPVNVYGSPLEGDMITTGTPLVSPPLVDMISNDPILGGVKVSVLSDSYLPAFDKVNTPFLISFYEYIFSVELIATIILFIFISV
jgi:hypothetical protein